jgi:glutamine synthetase
LPEDTQPARLPSTLREALDKFEAEPFWRNENVLGEKLVTVLGKLREAERVYYEGLGENGRTELMKRY